MKSVESDQFNVFVAQNIASGEFADPTPVRTVIAADFDNDKELEVFFNNIAYRGNAPNKLFRSNKVVVSLMNKLQ